MFCLLRVMCKPNLKRNMATQCLVCLQLRIALTYYSIFPLFLCHLFMLYKLVLWMSLDDTTTLENTFPMLPTCQPLTYHLHTRPTILWWAVAWNYVTKSFRQYILVVIYYNSFYNLFRIILYGKIDNASITHGATWFLPLSQDSLSNWNRLI